MFDKPTFGGNLNFTEFRFAFCSDCNNIDCQKEPPQFPTVSDSLLLSYFLIPVPILRSRHTVKSPREWSLEEYKNRFET